MSTTTVPTSDTGAGTTAVPVLLAISVCHLLNDMMQSLLPAIYPVLKTNYDLDFGQIGLLTFTSQATASLLQPLVGLYIDRRPKPYSLAFGMASTLIGLLLLAYAASFPMLLLASALVGIGSSVFHPESSRVARMAAGRRHGLAQSVFQVGGNAGSAIGPLLAAFIVLQFGQTSVAWFSLAALLGILLLVRVGHWYKDHGLERMRASAGHGAHATLPRRKTLMVMLLLVALIFSKFFYMAGMTSYYTFYLIDQFHVSVQSSQLLLFLFLVSVAAGTLSGGWIGDRIGRRAVIRASILGVLPFTLALPYANLFWTAVLTVPIGLILASAFPAIVVYAQELMPSRVGAVSGLFFGFAFGLGAIGAAVLGQLADATSIDFVYHLCSFLPVIGLLAGILPKLETGQ